MRINQFLARSGVASRRKAEDLILTGRVSINEKVVTDLVTRIDQENDRIVVDGLEVKLPKYVYLLLNKPAGYTCTRSDAHAAHTVFELLPDDPSLVTVGRLDRETTGLLLVTNDGQFAQNIIHPSKKIEKEYQITLKKPASAESLDELVAGVFLEDGLAKAKLVTRISDREIALVVEMGRKRIVRRMIAAVGNEVAALRRIRIGSIVLDVPGGQCRELTEKEIAAYA